MLVNVLDRVQLSDGRLIRVTSVVDQEAPEVKENPDDLFMGHLLHFSTVTNAYFADYSELVINPMSEVVAIRTDIVIK
jgi:hypothetical protein